MPEATKSFSTEAILSVLTLSNLCTEKEFEDLVVHLLPPEFSKEPPVIQNFSDSEMNVVRQSLKEKLKWCQSQLCLDVQVQILLIACRWLRNILAHTPTNMAEYRTRLQDQCNRVSEVFGCTHRIP